MVRQGRVRHGPRRAGPEHDQEEKDHDDSAQEEVMLPKLMPRTATLSLLLVGSCFLSGCASPGSAPGMDSASTAGQKLEQLADGMG